MNNLFTPQYCDANSILLINGTGVIRKLYCPFRVKFIGTSNDFKSGVFLWVDEVATNHKDELVYWIMTKPYLYSSFEIIATF